jgi:hypothetical protein
VLHGLILGKRTVNSEIKSMTLSPSRSAEGLISHRAYQIEFPDTAAPMITNSNRDCGTQAARQVKRQRRPAVQPSLIARSSGSTEPSTANHPNWPTL